MIALTLNMLRWVLPLWMGLIVYEVARGILNVSTTIDYLPSAAKRVVVVGIGGAVSYVFAWLHMTTPEECAAVTSIGSDAFVRAVDVCATALNTKAPLQGLAAAGVAMVIHKLKKSNPRN